MADLKVWSDESDFSDDGDAPEEVTLSESRTAHIALKRHIEHDSRVAKTKKKKINKQKDCIYKAQKEAKLGKLALTRLPDAVLDSISDEETVETIATSLPQSRLKQFDSDSDTEDVDSDANIDGVEDEGEDEGEDGDSGINSEIMGKVTVQIVREVKASSGKAALAFRRLRECGAHANLKRLSMKERQFIKEKRAQVTERSTR